MSDSELETWRRTRACGRGLFVGKIILRRCLWLSVPVLITLLLAGWHSKPKGDFWLEYQFLIWIFAGATLIIGFGDGLFLWKIRERDYQRKMRAPAPEPPAFPSRSRVGQEAKAVPAGNSWN